MALDHAEAAGHWLGAAIDDHARITADDPIWAAGAEVEALIGIGQALLAVNDTITGSVRAAAAVAPGVVTGARAITDAVAGKLDAIAGTRPQPGVEAAGPDDARDEVLAAIGRFENDLAFTAPELFPMRINELRSAVRAVFEDEDGEVMSGE